MAYRPLHRSLGETSLELKCLFFFGVALVLVIAVSLLLHWQVTKRTVNEQNPITGALLAEEAVLLLHLEELFSDPETDNEQKMLEVVNATSSNLLTQEYVSRIIRRPDSPFQPLGREWSTGPMDGFEKGAMAEFVTGEPEETDTGEDSTYRYRLLDNGDKYQYCAPVRAKQLCTSCHRLRPGLDLMASTGTATSPGNETSGVGALMAMVEVTIPNQRTEDALNKSWAILLAVSIITAFLAIIAFYVTIRYVIIRPLKHLRHVSDAISHGELATRADIHTGDEFEGLGVAFNRMLGHLGAIQDELRQVNVDLDGKVDELAQLNMQLYETNRVKSDFLATMSHELRTPLNSILGFSDVLGSIDSLDAKQKRYVDNIRKSGRMLLEMINSILDLAKIESGRMDVRPSDFNIAAVVGAQCDMARPLTEKKNIDLVTEIARDLPPVHQDQARVQQILNNLLSNAIKFTPEGGRIRVSAVKTDSDELVLRVSDTGVGIAKEDQQAIFEKFRQGKTAMPGGDAFTREYSGTGLGLSIVKELCKLLEGEVWVQSELGMGSTFTVRLPWDLRVEPHPERPLTAEFDQYGKLRMETTREG